MQSSVSSWLHSSAGRVGTLLTAGLLLVLGMIACSDSVAPQVNAPRSVENQNPAAVMSAQEATKPPTIKGGMEALSNRLQYPDLARKAGVEGRVFVEFVVDESGQAQQVQVKQGVHRALDSAAVQAVREVAFEPGRHENETTAIKMTLPIHFKLPHQEKASASNGDVTFTRPERAPEIEGGMDALRSELSYPKIVHEAGIEGTVHVTFTVSETGAVEDARITKSVHEELDAAALQAVQNVSFKPAMEEGSPTRHEMTLPITFSHSDTDPAK